MKSISRVILPISMALHVLLLRFSCPYRRAIFSRTSPRQGKSERSFYGAAAVFAIYYILSGLAQTWVEQGTISRVPGVWWLYILMALFAFSLLSSWFQQKLFLRR